MGRGNHRFRNIFLRAVEFVVSNPRWVAGHALRLSGQFGQKLEPVDGRGDAEVAGAGFFLDAQHAGLAAHPAFFASSQLRGKHEDEIKQASWFDFCPAIKEDAVGTEVASLAGAVNRVLSFLRCHDLNRDRNTQGVTGATATVFILNVASPNLTGSNLVCANFAGVCPVVARFGFTNAGATLSGELRHRTREYHIAHNYQEKILEWKRIPFWNK
jgi:hypothetical protein